MHTVYHFFHWQHSIVIALNESMFEDGVVLYLHYIANLF